MVLTKEIKCELVKKIYKVVSVIIAFTSSVFLWYWNVSPGWSEGYNGWFTLTCVGGVYVVIYLIFAKMYQALKIGIYRVTEVIFSQCLAFGVADLFLMVESCVWFHGPRKTEILSYLLTYLFQIVFMTVIIFIFNKAHAKYDTPRKVMIVYGNSEYKHFQEKLLSKGYRYNIVACFDENTDFGKIKMIADECVSVYLYDVKSNIKKDLIYYCKLKGKNVYITQDIEELIVRGFDVSHTFDTPFVRTKRVPVKWYYPIVKRTVDICGSFLGLIVLSPVFLVVAILIKKYDGGPVFYKQTRLTKGHKEFEIYKFRSMIVDAEKNGAQLASVEDDRITPIGKFIRSTRIDEFPQLINILKGDMSIIGPRPERPEIEKEYLKDVPEFAFRLDVPAGLSGYAQVFGKYNTKPEDKLKLDLMYINQRSLLLDFKLMLYTAKIIFVPESTEGVK